MVQFSDRGGGRGPRAVVAGAVGGMVGGPVSDAIHAASQPAKAEQPAPADDMAAFKAKVEKLGIMKESGLITDEEFAAMKAELLKNIL